VSIPIDEIDVSPWSTSTASMSHPSRSATIWAQAVSWLWPCGDVPVITCTEPVGRQRIVAWSQPPAA
jgi:hypothetical protein